MSAICPPCDAIITLRESTWEPTYKEDGIKAAFMAWRPLNWSPARAVACRFYERHCMKVASAVAWKNGTIPGLVYRLTAPLIEALGE